MSQFEADRKLRIPSICWNANTDYYYYWN